ncbi:MAG: Arc family DNA-binding protein [Candidatus Thiothrix sulfatifontis]|nr:MAG: Arc family DNA-binding protein [Candidatus Thiothrix sulfatifontis]
MPATQVKTKVEFKMTKVPFKLNLPEDIHDWLAKRAEANGRARSSELVQILKAVKSQDAENVPKVL